jgi:ABC-type Mn2+/Zn2+ transport system ATPase subunit
MDEPFTGVDASTQEATLRLLDDLHLKQVTILISTHDLVLAAERFDDVLLLNRRLISYGPASQAFTRETLAQAFGGKMLVLPSGEVVVDECCPPGEELDEVHSTTPDASGAPK